MRGAVSPNARAGASPVQSVALPYYLRTDTLRRLTAAPFWDKLTELEIVLPSDGAEAISVLANSMALAANFGTGEVTARDLAAGLQGSVVKDEEKDRTVWQEYLSNVLKKRGADWRPLFTACSEHNE